MEKVKWKGGKYREIKEWREGERERDEGETDISNTSGRGNSGCWERNVGVEARVKVGMRGSSDRFK